VAESSNGSHTKKGWSRLEKAFSASKLATSMPTKGCKACGRSSKDSVTVDSQQMHVHSFPQQTRSRIEENHGAGTGCHRGYCGKTQVVYHCLHYFVV
jgi:hypothetical protein